MASVNLGVSGNTYLVTQEQFKQLPIGTVYMVLTDDPNVFAGKIALLINNTSPAEVLVQILSFGWESAPTHYPQPSGQPLVEEGMFFNFVTKQLVDPLAGTPDEVLIESMIFRGLHI